MVMSFMGAIGYIMAGSGLKQLMSVIYAEQSVDKMLSGHAYGRAVRAHILCHVAVAKIIWQAIELTEDEWLLAPSCCVGPSQFICNDLCELHSLYYKALWAEYNCCF